MLSYTTINSRHSKFVNKTNVQVASVNLVFVDKPFLEIYDIIEGGVRSVSHLDVFESYDRAISPASSRDESRSVRYVVVGQA